MMRMGPDPSVSQWISQNIEKGKNIGFDPALVSVSSAKARIKAGNDLGFNFVPVAENLINKVWIERPEMSNAKAFIHELQYANQSVAEKLTKVINKMKHNYLFTSVLDDIAWLLNLRGTDIDYNPLFFSYLLIDRSKELPQLYLFINQDKVEHIQEYLSSNNINTFPYTEVGDFLHMIEDEITIDESDLNYLLYQKIKKPVHEDNIIARLKAVKTEREIKGFRDCHIRDATALIKYLSWLETQLKTGVELNEWTAALELDRFRAAEDLNKGLSFENISSSGPNAAVIHYAPTAEKARALNLNEIYLLDTGGQYLDGTTDTTRTVHFGSPTDWEKECFTRVLLGNLDLERVRWPSGTRLAGNDLDVLARRRLWEVGLDYCHATGHGVGYFLNVHEGPHVLCKGSFEVFQVGMNISNEPGYYEEGNFGIRIENILFVVNSQSVNGYVEFENVTMVPYDKSLLDKKLLSQDDVDYINAYHQKIFDVIGPILLEKNENNAYEWLKTATQPIRLD